MRVLIIGGTGITGPYTTDRLVRAGHEVAVFNRGQSTGQIPKSVLRLTGDKTRLQNYRQDLLGFRPDAVVHMAAFRRDETREFLSIFEGQTDRIVCISSIDVYAAYARLKRTEPGPLQEVPIREDADLRATIEPQGLDYDKLGVEDELSSGSLTPTTILRFPGVYGPRDGLRRLYPYLRRMDDGRSFMLVDENVAGFRFSKAYSENVAQAVFLAVVSEEAGRVYNVAEPEALKEADWIQLIGRLAGWQGEIVLLPPDEMPGDHPEEDDVSQDWVVDSCRIREELGFEEVVPLEEGLARTIEWERAQPRSDLYQIDYTAEDEAYKAYAGT